MGEGTGKYWPRLLPFLMVTPRYPVVYHLGKVVVSDLQEVGLVALRLLTFAGAGMAVLPTIFLPSGTNWAFA